jgi:carotenoid cleavage dioxygenase-like enzyme
MCGSDARRTIRPPIQPRHLACFETEMIHECAISKNWIILILLPLCSSLDRLKQGRKRFTWDNDLPMTLGFLPRNNLKSEDIRWYL